MSILEKSPAGINCSHFLYKGFLYCEHGSDVMKKRAVEIDGANDPMKCV